MTNEKGVTLLVPAIDQWYPANLLPAEAKKHNVELKSFRIDEPRLAQRLEVSHFRLPPDYNYRRSENKLLTMPAQRFPRWHVCPQAKCGSMLRPSPSDGLRVLCENRKEHSGDFDVQMHQVRFVMMCDHGHLADFPWREWVHYSSHPDCQGDLRMNKGGGADLASIEVSCKKCGLKRRLGGILQSAPDGGASFLSRTLDKSGAAFNCTGQKPWATAERGSQAEPCQRPVQGSLLNATNLHFSEVVSAIFLPPVPGSSVPDELIRLLSEPPLTIIRGFVTGGTLTLEEGAEYVRAKKLVPDGGIYSDEHLRKALAIACGLEKLPQPANINPDDHVAVERAFRYQEYGMLQNPLNTEMLVSRRPPLENYAADMQHLLSGVTLLDKLRETRVLTGISRVNSAETTTMTSDQRRHLLRKKPFEDNTWLPAAITFGEGIFLQFDTTALGVWEKAADKHLSGLMQRYEKSDRHKPGHLAGPRHVLLHTFAHLLINQLIFECGYSSASLRERLYVSQEAGQEMAGVLIYTASGDAEGTMGGLVRCGEPGNLEPLIRRAVSGAQWCAADPICMEAGESGQGPDSCNLAACHNCALLPETSCEEFNRFLDRACIVGGERVKGYFASLLIHS